MKIISEQIALTEINQSLSQEDEIKTISKIVTFAEFKEWIEKNSGSGDIEILKLVRKNIENARVAACKHPGDIVAIEVPIELEDVGRPE